MSRRWTSAKAVKRYVAQGRIIGFSARRLPMIEFECEAIMSCVQWLINPRVVFGRDVQESCQVAGRLIEAFYELQFVFVQSQYGLPPKEIWKALPRKRTGEIAGPLAISVGNKSLHVWGFTKIHLDKFDVFVEMLRALECVDPRYLDMSFTKKEFTLRLTGKERYGLKPVRPVLVAELAEYTTGKWGLFTRMDRRVYQVLDLWMYRVFQVKGFGVYLEGIW